MSKRRLIVVVRGIAGLRKTWAPLLARLQQEPELARDDVAWLAWEHGAHLLSCKRMERLAADLSAAIHVAWVKNGGFDEVVLMGHSLGGVLVRQAYLLASGCEPDQPQPQPWAQKVTRMILLAAPNRGASGLARSPEEGRTHSLLLLAWLMRVVVPLQRLLISQLMRGSSFLTNLRIAWIRHFAALESPPLVVQLRGARDPLVHRNDSLDVDQLRSGWHVTVPGSRHSDLHVVSGPLAEARYTLIRAALLDDAPRDGENRAPVMGPERVVFLMHGIRSSNSRWPAQLGALLARFASGAPLKVVTPTYGFFTALKFAMPTTRRKHLAWFQDQYAEFLAQNPRAEFLFVGHSNGTYLFGQSLLRVPAMRFTRAVLVASVLPQDYAWELAVARGQVKSVCCVRSNRDVPVGILCSAMRGLGMSDVGTAGFHGFRYADPSVMREIFWYDGGHSKALEHPHLDHLVQYLFPPTDGASPRPTCDPACIVERDPPATYALLSNAAPWLARGLGLSALLGFGWLLLVGSSAGAAAGVLLMVGFFVLRDLI